MPKGDKQVTQWNGIDGEKKKNIVHKQEIAFNRLSVYEVFVLRGVELSGDFVPVRKDTICDRVCGEIE